MANKGTCKAPSCDKEVQAKGYCAQHYSKWRKGELPKPRYKSCNAEGCHKPRLRRGLCAEHFTKEHGKKSEAAPAAAAS